MSKMAAIDVAVRLQLVDEGKFTIDYQHAMNAAPYTYDKGGMQRFLLSVANRLKCDTPPLAFAWNSLNPDDCLTVTLPILIGMIEIATTAKT